MKETRNDCGERQPAGSLPEFNMTSIGRTCARRYGDRPTIPSRHRDTRKEGQGWEQNRAKRLGERTRRPM
jgi:hypothetical protein